MRNGRIFHLMNVEISPLDFTAKDCWKGFLLRTAKNSKDYTGGTNHYTNLKGFMPLLEQLLG